MIMATVERFSLGLMTGGCGRNFIALAGGGAYIETSVTQLAPGDEYEVTVSMADAATVAGCTVDLHVSTQRHSCLCLSSWPQEPLLCMQVLIDGHGVWETTHPYDSFTSEGFFFTSRG